MWTPTTRLTTPWSRSISAEVSFQLAEHAAQEALTPLEIGVLQLIAEGKANKEIAGQLSLSEGAVNRQVRSILSKLDASDRTQAVTIGLRRGIIEL